MTTEATNERGLYRRCRPDPGLQTVCEGGGMANATIIQRL